MGGPEDPIPGRTLAGADRAALARKGVQVDMDVSKLVLFLLAVYGTYHSAKTAWRLGNELFG